MGNCCGKESSSNDPFSQPGRTLSSAPDNNNKTARIPAKVGGPPQKLGSSSSSQAHSQGQDPDARRKAAEAAEARAKAANKPKGTLGGKLEQQKKQTRAETLDEASKDTRRQRDADATAETQAYN